MTKKPNYKSAWWVSRIAKHGSVKEVKRYMREIATTGGRNGKGHKFGHGLVDPGTVGKIGGVASGVSKRSRL